MLTSSLKAALIILMRDIFSTNKICSPWQSMCSAVDVIGLMVIEKAILYKFDHIIQLLVLSAKASNDYNISIIDCKTGAVSEVNSPLLFLTQNPLSI